MSLVIDNFRGEYSFLSNFYLAHFYFIGLEWKSSEHLYQAMKTFDKDEREEIRNCVSAKESKILGKKVTKRKDWEDKKIEVMEIVVFSKFSQIPHLSKKLINTGDAELIEGNNWGDRFWGVCDGEGENHLGIILMKTREKIKLIFGEEYNFKSNRIF